MERIALLVLALATAALAGKEFSPPRPGNAKTYPAHDEHPQERVTIAVDPYDRPEKAAVFKTKWREYDYLPVQLIITNDSDQTIALTQMKVQLVTGSRTKLQPAADEDLFRRVSRVRRRGDEPQRPLPLPRRRGPDVGVSKDTLAEVQAAQFHALAVDAHSTQSGFLFFDVQDIENPLAGAHLYVTGVKDGEGQELMFFDVPLEKPQPQP